MDAKVLLFLGSTYGGEGTLVPQGSHILTPKPSTKRAQGNPQLPSKKSPWSSFSFRPRRPRGRKGTLLLLPRRGDNAFLINPCLLFLSHREKGMEDGCHCHPSGQGVGLGDCSVPLFPFLFLLCLREEVNGHSPFPLLELVVSPKNGWMNE